MPPLCKDKKLVISCRLLIKEGYHGWQQQQNVSTVQEALQACLAQILQNEVLIVESSRTNAGVHACQQFAHVDLANTLVVGPLHRQFNATLPPDSRPSHMARKAPRPLQCLG